MMRLLFCLWTAFLSSTAYCHLMPKGKATLNIAKSSDYLVASFDRDVFQVKLQEEQSWLDIDDEIKKQFKENFTLEVNGKSYPWKAIHLNNSFQEPNSDHAHKDALIIMARSVKLPKFENIRIRSKLWSASFRKLSLKSRNKENQSFEKSEHAVLSPENEDFTFFTKIAAQRSH